MISRANVAQLAEQRIRNAQVIGSIPIVGSNTLVGGAQFLVSRDSRESKDSRDSGDSERIGEGRRPSLRVFRPDPGSSPPDGGQAGGMTAIGVSGFSFRVFRNAGER